MKDIPVNDQPVTVHLNPADGSFSPCVELVQRKVSHLERMFHDQAAVRRILETGDRVVYEIRYHPFLTSCSDMALGTTTIFPGKVGDEYHMTKGHFHERPDQPEIYHCIAGEGFLQLMTASGEYHAVPWKPETITHIPPQFAHRVVNTGASPLIFVAVYHVSAGHAYGPIEKSGFRFRIVEVEGKPQEILNPDWAPV